MLADDLVPTGADSPAATHPEGPTILVVDDSTAMRDRVADVLSPLGRVVTCFDGISALEVIEAHHIDLVVTDVMMPRLDGLGLVERLRADPRHGAIPIVVLSARAGTDSATSALELGADDYVVKPFTTAELLARCRNTLELSRLRSDQAAARARDQVLAGVSHDMQTPLSVILSGLDLLSAEMDEPTRSDLVRRTRRRAGTLDRLVRQFLDWSQITSGTAVVVSQAPTDLAALLDRVVSHYPGLTLPERPPSQRPVHCDSRRTEQILHTLLANAIEVATGPVEIRVAECSDAAGDFLGYDVEIHDDGPGVSEDVLPTLFTPRGLSGSPGHAGIGLFVSRVAAAAQGGELTLGSSDQHGSVFVLRLRGVA